MRYLVVTFYKEVNHFFDDNTLEKVEFEHKIDPNKSDYDNQTDAYEIAISKGHNPNKNIMFKEVER
jgi:hypothetical protein